MHGILIKIGIQKWGSQDIPSFVVDFVYQQYELNGLINFEI